MTTHIEHAVTELISTPEASASGEQSDQRWVEQEKIEAVIARSDRMRLRVSAEGLDD
jgi:hypothetical protein